MGTFPEQTVKTLIRCLFLWHLIWVCTICQCPTNRILGLYGLSLLQFTFNSHNHTQQNQVYTVSISTVQFLKDTFEGIEIPDEILVPTAYAIDRPPDKSAYYTVISCLFVV